MIINRRVWVIATALYMGAIGYFSLQPSSGMSSPLTQQVFKNALHCFAYGGLTYLLLQSIQYTLSARYAIACIIAVAYGALNEYIQAFVPGRTASFSDILLNAIGIGVVALIVKHNPNRFYLRT